MSRASASRHHLRTDSSLSLSEDLPAVAIAVDTRQRIEAVRDQAVELTHSGLVTLERARMQTGEIQAVSLPAELDEATKLTVYLGRQERVYRVPAFIAVCDLLHRRGSPVPPRCSGSTAPRTACANEHVSSAATSTCR